MQLRNAFTIIVWYWLPPIALAAFIFFLSMRPDLKSDFPELVDFILRKIAHVTEFFILTLFLARIGLRGVTTIRVRFAVFAVAGLGALMTAIFDESIQRYIPGRVGSYRDVFIDGVGVTFAIAILLWYYVLKSRSLKTT